MPISALVTQENHSNTARICVIGAGSAGLTTVKALKEGGFEPVCFEMGTEVGGLWAIENENGRGGAYDSLHINTSTKAMEFSDFPMRTDIGDYPSHPHIAGYFRSYADHFGLLAHIRFRKRVVKCGPVESGYLVTIEDRESRSREDIFFGALVVCNGHHWSPAYPTRTTWEAFDGHVMHANAYRNAKDPHDFNGQRALVVGMGNSAMDIACELSKDNAAHSVQVSARRGAWVLPKYLLGKPIDQGSLIPQWLPSKIRRRIVTASFRMIEGPMQQYGLPEPDHLIGEAHPTVSDEFPERVKTGVIQMRSAIESCQGRNIRFVDGSEDHFDAIVFCTGYNVEFPFFDEEHISAPNNRLPLYHRAFHLKHRRVFFVGLAQTVGAIMPVAETQARAIAAHLAGEYSLPEVETMERRVKAEEDAMRQRFVPSLRHSMQVIPEHFQPRLAKDCRAGKKRAERGEGIAFPGFSEPALSDRGEAP